MHSNKLIFCDLTVKHVDLDEDSFLKQAYDDWGPEDNEKLYLGYYSAAVPEGVNIASDYTMENSIPVWDAITDYGLDKVAHFGFSFFGASALMKGSETFPEYMKRMEDSEAPFSDQIHAAGVKLSEPSMQQKATLAFTGVAVLGFCKELTDAYIDIFDLAANMGGASTAVLDEYGDGSVKRGAEKTFQDIKEMLEEQEEQPEKVLYTNGGQELTPDRETLENMEALGKL